MKRNFLLLWILTVGVFGILNTEMGIIGVLLMVADRYGVDIVEAGWLVSLFALGVAIAGPTMPLLASRFDRRRVMLLVLAVFTVCNIVSTIAPSFEVLLAARVIPAFFHPVYCALAFSTAAELAGPADAPKAVARINMGVAAGMVIGVPVSNYLAAYGILNVVGNYLGGTLLTRGAIRTVRFFPLAVLAVYAVFLGGTPALPLALLAALIFLWGLLGGINANINQFWLARAIPEAPGFANGLFLTAANLGTMAATWFCGLFIHALGIASVFYGGLTFATLAALLVWGQTVKESKAERAVAAMKRMSEEAEKAGIADMTLEEIYAEIDAARNQVRA